MSKKICVVGPALTMGGMERASVNIANGLIDLNVDVVHVVILKQPHFFQLNDRITFYEPDNFNHSKLSFFKTIFWLRGIIKEENPSAVLVYNKLYGAMVMIALLFTKIKVVISERSSPLYPWPKKFKIINKIAFTLNPPNGIIAQTELAKQYQKIYFGRNSNIVVIPNALRKVELFPEIQREQIILAVGRLEEYIKGFDRLIDAFSKLKNKEWKLVFAGGDEKGEQLKVQAKTLGIHDRIQFLGKVKEIDKVYAKAGIFVMPSRSEGFPNALCEAMGAGVPCISFDFVAGPRDIISDGIDGYIIEDGNIKMLAQKIDELILDKEKRFHLGQKAMGIRERLNKEKITKSYLDFLIS